MRLVLASASPRRLDLLARIGVVPDAVVPAEIDESVPAGELPRNHALRLARQKAEAIAEREPDALILAADTVVAVGRRILPKVEDEATLRELLATIDRTLTGAGAQAAQARIAKRTAIDPRPSRSYSSVVEPDVN